VSSFCLSVRSFVCLSSETRTTGGGGGLSRRPFGPHWLVLKQMWKHTGCTIILTKLMFKNQLSSNGEENEKVIRNPHADPDHRQRSHPLPVPVKFGRRPCPRSSVYRMTEQRNDHVTYSCLVGGRRLSRYMYSGLSCPRCPSSSSSFQLQILNTPLIQTEHTSTAYSCFCCWHCELQERPIVRRLIPRGPQRIPGRLIIAP